MRPAAHEPEDFARALRTRCKLSGAVDLYELAGRIGLKIKEVDSERFEGALVRKVNEPTGIVAVRRGIREAGRKNFTIAHEIGHYILPGHGVVERTCSQAVIESGNKQIPAHETAANLFASEFLMPSAEVQPVVRAKLASIETAQLLAARFSTSLTAALLKSAALTDERCCVVLSKNSVIEWARPNTAFNHFVSRGERLSAESLAYKLMNKDLEGSAQGVVPAAAWLDSNSFTPNATIYEDSCAQPYYDRVLTLLTITEPLGSQVLEEDEELLDELDPNDFTVNRTRWPGKS